MVIIGRQERESQVDGWQERCAGETGPWARFGTSAVGLKLGVRSEVDATEPEWNHLQTHFRPDPKLRAEDPEIEPTLHARLVRWKIEYYAAAR